VTFSLSPNVEECTASLSELGRLTSEEGHKRKQQWTSSFQHSKLIMVAWQPNGNTRNERIKRKEFIALLQQDETRMRIALFHDLFLIYYLK
jgi:hypothetical protein